MSVTYLLGIVKATSEKCLELVFGFNSFLLCLQFENEKLYFDKLVIGLFKFLKINFIGPKNESKIFFIFKL